MLNFLGVAQNFSVLAETAWESTFLFVDEVTGDVQNMDAVTFEGWVMVQDTKYEMRFTRAGVDGMKHLVQVTVPKLPEGRWAFEIFCAVESGEKSRLIYGFVSAVGGLDSDSGKTYENRTLEVRLPGDATRRLQLEWQATSAAMLAATEANNALKLVQEVQAQVDGVKAELVSQAEAARDEAQSARDEAQAARDEARQIVDDAPREYVPEISDDGFWVINGVKTDKRAVGQDGVNGADAVTVVRHVISDASELPDHGATCSGGHLYYVRKPDVPASAQISLRDGVSLPDVLELTVNGVAVSASTAGLQDVSEVPALLLEAVMAQGIEGVSGEVEGDALRLSTSGLTLTVDAEDQGVLDVVETPLHVWRSALCYAWCLDADGTGSWVLIDADGMATAGDGASGGNGYIQPGGGSATVQEATSTTLGTVKLGTDEMFFGDTVPVGRDSEGRLSVEVGRTVATATYSQYGIVRLGSQFNVLNEIPYRLSITANEDGRLCQNLATGGAVKHMQRPGWEALGPTGIQTDAMSGLDYYLGLHASASFTQSQQQGLEMLPATQGQIGGVTLASGLSDDEPAHVLDATMLRAAIYSKIQVDSLLESYIKTNTTLFSIRIMTTEEYDALAQIDAHTLYLVY